MKYMSVIKSKVKKVFPLHWPSWTSNEEWRRQILHVDANSEQLLPACCFKLVLYNPFILSKVSSTARRFKLMAYHTLWLRLSNLNPMRSRAQFQLLLFSLQLYKDRTLANKGRRVRPATLAPHSHKPDRCHTNGDFFSTASHSGPMINHSINIWNKLTVEHIKGLDLSRANCWA